MKAPSKRDSAAGPGGLDKLCVGQSGESRRPATARAAARRCLCVRQRDAQLSVVLLQLTHSLVPTELILRPLSPYPIKGSPQLLNVLLDSLVDRARRSLQLELLDLASEGVDFGLLLGDLHLALGQGGGDGPQVANLALGDLLQRAPGSVLMPGQAGLEDPDGPLRRLRPLLGPLCVPHGQPDLGLEVFDLRPKFGCPSLSSSTGRTFLRESQVAGVPEFLHGLSEG